MAMVTIRDAMVEFDALQQKEASINIALVEAIVAGRSNNYTKDQADSAISSLERSLNDLKSHLLNISTSLIPKLKENAKSKK